MKVTAFRDPEGNNEATAVLIETPARSTATRNLLYACRVSARRADDPARVERNTLPRTVTVPAAGGTTSVALSVPLSGCDVTVTEVAVPGWEAVGNMTQTLRVYQRSPQVTVSITNQPIPTPTPIPIGPIAPPQFTG